MKFIPALRLARLALPLFLAALSLTPSLGVAAAATAAKPPAEQTIEIKNFMFMTLTVTKGTKVTWINRDEVPHTVIEKTKLFHSAALDTGDSYSYVFDTPGTYEYYCSLHPQMVAEIIVTDPPAPIKAAHKARPKA